MVEKLHEYQGFVGRIHTWREQLRDFWENTQQSSKIPSAFSGIWGKNNQQQEQSDVVATDRDHHDFSHIYRKKSRFELIRVSATVMGLEFAYAAETAFVSPTLLKIGVEHEHMTLVWALPPLIGFFLVPLLGSLSDRCRLRWGRRRPFIIMLAIGVLLGLILVPNGEDIGHALGDFYPSRDLPDYNSTLASDNSTAIETPSKVDAEYAHPWGVFFTILGTVLLDFDADACQSPARAYLLDVVIPDDHARGLSTFTIMAGLGGFLGYGLGGINWDETIIGEMLGGHVRAVFTLISFIFVICVSYTITSFKEIPLDILENKPKEIPNGEFVKLKEEHELSYGTVTASNSTILPQNEVQNRNDINPCTESVPNPGFDNRDLSQTTQETTFNGSDLTTLSSVVNPTLDANAAPTLDKYLLSILYMPNSLRILCLTNLFCWMAHVCYSLYFTDFVGEAVFKGDPKAPFGSESKRLYEEGVRFGCWGMSMYSLSCACYSLIIEKLIKRFGARRVYVGGLLFYSTGMFMMACTQNRVGVILFSWTAGVMYSTLFTMPFILVAHYHASETFEVSAEGNSKVGTQVRGIGTDVAILSSMVFLAQFILSMFMGSIVQVVGSTVAVIVTASTLAFCGSISAYHVMYLDL